MLKVYCNTTNTLAGSNYLHHSSTLFVVIFLTPWNFRRTIHIGVSSPVLSIHKLQIIDTYYLSVPIFN